MTSLNFIMLSGFVVIITFLSFSIGFQEFHRYIFLYTTFRFHPFLFYLFVVKPYEFDKEKSSHAKKEDLNNYFNKNKKNTHIYQ